MEKSWASSWHPAPHRRAASQGADPVPQGPAQLLALQPGPRLRNPGLAQGVCVPKLCSEHSLWLFLLVGASGAFPKHLPPAHPHTWFQHELPSLREDTSQPPPPLPPNSPHLAGPGGAWRGLAGCLFLQEGLADLSGLGAPRTSWTHGPILCLLWTSRQAMPSTSLPDTCQPGNPQASSSLQGLSTYLSIR